MALATTGSLGSNTTTDASSVTVSSWMLPADADLVVAAYAHDYNDGAGDTLASATLDGNAATGIVQVTHAEINYTLAALAYWLDGDLPTKGSAHNVVLTNSDFAANLIAGVQAFNGANTSTIEDSDTNTEHDGNDQPIDYDITTTTDNALIISCAAVSQGVPTWAAADSQTELLDAANVNVSMVFGYVAAGTAGNKVQGWNPNGWDRWVTATAALAIAPSAVDSTAPTLSSPSGMATGQTTAQLQVDTDEAGGTLYWVVTQSATSPSVAQVQAGQDHTGSAADDSGSQAVPSTGTQTISGGATGLVASTTYWAHFQQEDNAANDSTVVTSASFTTNAVPGGGGSGSLVGGGLIGKGLIGGGLVG